MDPFEFFYRTPRHSRTQNKPWCRIRSVPGVIVSTEAHIITNNHVVDQVDEIEVRDERRTRRKKPAVVSDATVDLAVLKVD